MFKLPIFMFVALCASYPAIASDLYYFPKNYSEAQQAFLKESQKWQDQLPGSRTYAFHVPSRSDDQLQANFLEIPAQKVRQTLLVIVSGVHGLEAYAGSAIQAMVFKEIFPAMNWDTTGVLMVHAMNPFGFKYHRRATENNVNLNRNFSTKENLFSTKNEAYRKFADFVAPQHPVSSPLNDFLANAMRLGLDLALGNLSIAEMNRAIGQGQYEFKSGLEFGGYSNEPQTTYFIDVLSAAAHDYKDIVILDLHTGLGEAYTLHLMPGGVEGSVDPGLFDKLFKLNLDSAIYKYTPNDSEGFYHTHGDLLNLLPELLMEGQRGLALTVEFGTLGNGSYAKLKTLNRLILENQGFHHGYTSKAVEQEVKSDFAELFYPEDPRWKKNVIAKARAIFKNLVHRL